MFMVPADVQSFSAMLAPRIRGIAAWTDYDGGTAGDDLAQILAEEGVQAFLRLLDRSGRPEGPLMQFLNGRINRIDGWDNRADGRKIPVVDRETLEIGRLAHTWLPADHSPEVQNRFSALATTAHRCIHQVTHPHVAHPDGSPWRAARIGTHAKRWLNQDPSRGIRDLTRYLRLTMP
ncbi:hypothetical protein [Actinomadura sp. 9N407]|uniref:hypothetical protein n=1 Tax=Actinomadura sp. 9N407 TaxID=3375154 RepID=UPI0037AEE8AB